MNRREFLKFGTTKTAEIAAQAAQTLAGPLAPRPEPEALVAAIDESTCLPWAGPECGACASSCPVPGALDWLGGVKPVIDGEVCTGCGLCREACIVDPKAIRLTARPADRA